MSGRWIASLLASLAFIPALAAAQEHPPDQLSKLLFEEYLDGPRKVNTTTILAASTIVADRGRGTGFWKDVLAELQSGDGHSEVNCVRILGNMLADDAGARDAIRRQKETGEVSASVPTVYLGPEVAAELLERGKKADRHRIDHYVIALVRARVPEARGFFTTILDERRPIPAGVPFGVDVPDGFHHNDGTRFHAAVGLAQLGDPAGYDWLIANCEDPNGFVQHARPYFAERSDIGACCRAALRQLSGDKPTTSHLATRAEWEAWWRPVDLDDLKGRAVRFQDP
jgi:hypothetical protein